MNAVNELQPLTQRQREVLNFVTAFSDRSGFCPTVREICTEFKFASPNAAVCHLKPLKRRGLVTWQENQARTIRPTEAGRDFVNGGTTDG